MKQILIAAMLAGAVFSNSANAQSLPVWEIGVGVGSLGIADYRGSDEYSSYVFPIPFLVYRGKFFKADRGGIRGELFNSENLTLNISLNASPTTSGSDNPLREGMPELDPTFELGPALNINISGKSIGQGWHLGLPVRGIFAFDTGSLRRVGWLAHPHAAYHSRTFIKGWRLRYNIGPYFGDQDFHSYFYGVDPQFATASRPAFQARSGYSGLSSQLSLSRRKGNIWYGGFLRYDNLREAEFIDSPLVETENYLVMGFGISWILGQSGQKR